MRKKYKITELKQTCLVSPSQWEGKIDTGNTIYIRYRWGKLSIFISYRPSEDIISAINGYEIFSCMIGDSYDGHLSYLDLINITKDFIEYPNIVVEE
jgi:hypothetical protein